MAFEVEIKFRVDDLNAVADRLKTVGASLIGEKTQSDHYFSHPARDFAETDEAFRLRTDDGVLRITYKGPRIDTTTKTRREIELELGSGRETQRQWEELLAALGFQSVAKVVKRRTVWDVEWNGLAIEAALDSVENVGDFVELELVADQAGLETAKQTVESLAQRLELTVRERRSYLEMLLETQR